MHAAVSTPLNSQPIAEKLSDVVILGDFYDAIRC